MKRPDGELVGDRGRFDGEHAVVEFRAARLRLRVRRLAADRRHLVGESGVVEQRVAGEQLALGPQFGAQVRHLRGRPEGCFVAGAGQRDHEDVLDRARFGERFGRRRRRRRRFFRGGRFGRAARFRRGDGRRGRERFADRGAWLRSRAPRRPRLSRLRGLGDAVGAGSAAVGVWSAARRLADQGGQRAHAGRVGQRRGDDRRGGDQRGGDEQAEALAGQARGRRDRAPVMRLDVVLHRGTSVGTREWPHWAQNLTAWP